MTYSSVINCFLFFIKQKTAYDMRISVCSSDVCSSDLHIIGNDPVAALSGKLGLGMVQDLLGFSRKTDEQARALRIASQTGQYVRIFDQLQRRRRFALF